MIRRFLCLVALLMAVPVWGANERAKTDRSTKTHTLLGENLSGEIRKIRTSDVGSVLVEAPAGGLGLVDQGISGVSDTDPWNVMIRTGAGAELGLAASPFAISIFDAASNLLGVSANPLFTNLHQVGGTAVSTGTGVIDAGTQRVVLPTDQPTLDTDVLTLPSVLAVDANNSTTTPLGSGATFTGAATDLVTNGKAQLVVSVFADQDSAAGGLEVQFSQDGTNWDPGAYKHAFTLDANVGRVFPIGPEAQFFRVVLTNGGVAQGALRLTTLLQRNKGHDPLHRVLDIVDGDRSVKLRKSILFAQKPDLSFANADMTAGGNLKFSLEEIDAGALPVPVSGTDADGVAPTEDPVLMAGQDGTNVQSLKTDTTGELQIDVLTMPGVAGDIAHDAVDSGNPQKIGGQARTTNPTAVADADRVDAIFDKLGRQITTRCPRELRVKNNITLTTTTETTLLAAGGAGVFRELYFLSMSNTSATNVRVDIRDSTAGSVWQSFLLAADGGGTVIQPVEFIPQATANNNWTAQLSGAVTDVRLSVVGCEDL